MKAKYLLALLPLFALGSCSTEPEVVSPRNPRFEYANVDGKGVIIYRDGETSTTGHVTYLMMGPFGYVTTAGFPYKGSVDELHYENTITLVAEAGSPLPDPSEVKTSVSGSTFRGWCIYDEDNDHVWPDYYDKVPEKSGVALKAIFDGTDAGGNTGGGGSGGGGTTSTGFGIITGNGVSYIGQAKGKNFEGYDEYLVTGVSLNMGDTFSLYDPSTLGKWAVDINPYSFADDPSAPTPDPARVASYVVKNTTDYTVMKSFTGDFYIQILYQQDRLYIQLV